MLVNRGYCANESLVNTRNKGYGSSADARDNIRCAHGHTFQKELKMFKHRSPIEFRLKYRLSQVFSQKLGSIDGTNLSR